MTNPSITPVAADTGGLMSSIAAVREILMMNNVAENQAVNDLHNHKQQSYEERVKLKEDIEKQRSLVEELQSKVEQGREEVRREKSLRQALEASHAALEEHKKELLMQLELVKESRTSLEGKFSGFRDDLDKENDAFKQEREKWEALVNEMRSQNEKTLQNAGELEARLLAAQRQTKEIESRLSSMKKEVEASAKRREETIQGYVNTNEQLMKRIELGNVTSIESLQARLNESEAARATAVERMRKALVDLYALQQGLSPDEIKKVKDRKENVSTELASLKSSLEKASKDLTASEKAVAEFEEDESKSYELAKAIETLDKRIEAVCDIWTKLEVVYGRQLELAKSDADKASLDLTTVRERWRDTNDDVTSSQAEVERCQSQRAKMLEKSLSKKRASGETSSVAEKRRKS